MKPAEPLVYSEIKGWQRIKRRFRFVPGRQRRQQKAGQQNARDIGEAVIGRKLKLA